MKILVIRFSSIGDVILTSPIVRSLKKQIKAEIHFLIKKDYQSLVRNNPHIDKIFTLDDKVTKALRKEKYDLILDLQKSLKSKKIILSLGIKYLTFNKLNIQKWLKVNTSIDLLPETHLVDRYYDSISSLKVVNDGDGLDLYIDQESEDKGDQISQPLKDYGCLCLGATYYTKRIPIEKCHEIIQLSPLPLLTLGGKDTIEIANQLNTSFPSKIINMCGKTDIQVSARLIQNAQYIISGDTGMMHIAAAYQKKLYSLWGNTIPKFGMYPYYGSNNKDKNTILEVVGLKCRPCSKLGFENCPKSHFNCMKQIDVSHIRF